MSIVNKTVLVSFIASLPLLSIIKFKYGISLPQILFGLIFLFGAMRVLLTNKIPSVFNELDAVIFTYLAFTLVASIYSDSDTVVSAQLKSNAYFLAYLMFKASLSQYTIEDAVAMIRRGVLLGLGFAVGAVLLSLGMLVKNDYSFGFSYYGFTYPVIRNASEMIGLVEISKNAHVMQNPLAEIFLLYLMLLFFTARSKFIVNRVAGFACLLFIFILHSRRVILGVVIWICSQFFIFKRARFLIISTLLIVFGLAVGWYSVLCGAGLDALSSLFLEDGRLRHYAHVINQIGQKPITGYGYAAKGENDVYVHNFILGNLYMHGLFGGLISLLVVTVILRRWLLSIVEEKGHTGSHLLIIPLLGLAVGSSVEGMFTLGGWVALGVQGYLLEAQGDRTDSNPRN